MKDSMTLKSDDEDSSMSQYKDMFMEHCHRTDE